MINPTAIDIGRLVIYRARHPSAKLEQGVVTSFNQDWVFVRYGLGTQPAPTRREDLEWAHPAQADKLVEAALCESILDAE